MIDVPTLRSWIEAIGYEVAPEGPSTLRLRPPAGEEAGAPLPPFFAKLSDEWLLLSMLPVISRAAYRAADLGRPLLAANREMRLAKFALDTSGAVVLNAELPTESLDASEVTDAIQRMTEYARRFLAELKPG